jgi:hypothetical protein
VGAGGFVPGGAVLFVEIASNHLKRLQVTGDR